MGKRTTLICSFLVFAFSYMQPAYSQNILSTELNATPLAVNPAFTGIFNGDLRICGIYWNEWSNAIVPFVTYGASVDMPVFTDNQGNYLGCGIQAIKSVAGDENIYDFSAIASIAYHKLFRPLHDSSYHHNSELSVGVQAGYSQNSIDVSDLYFGQFFVPPSFTIQPYPLFGPTDNYYSVNAGICFTHAAGSRFNYTIGLAGYNLDQPTDAAKEDEYRRIGIDRRYIGEIGADWMITNRLTLRPEILFQSRPGDDRDFIAGNEFLYKMKDGATSAFIGAWYRTGDIMEITAGVEYRAWRLGVGYDYDFTTPNENSDGNGGFSLSLRRVVPGKKISNRSNAFPATRF